MKKSLNRLPSISVLIPTLNSAKVLGKCLRSIASQDYPKNKLEIIIADGGSTDKTLEIGRKYGAKIYKNKLKTGEAGKAVALKHAQGELVALIDSDNLLPARDWFKKMVAPFSNLEIIGSEPWKFNYRPKDGFIDRYCALLGMNDPLCLFLGNYDRFSVLTGRWTGMIINQKDRGGWIEAELKLPGLPTIGANGTILRRLILTETNLVSDFLFDIDIIAKLAEKKPVKFAKVKIGIVHLFCGSDIAKFIRKQSRRAKDYLYYQKIGVRKYPWQKQNKWGMLKFILACVTIGPLVFQALKGYFKKPDRAWFFHPLACWLTLVIYSWVQTKAFFGIKAMSRKKWRQ